MACGGIHCAGCAGGAAVPVVPLCAFLGLAWVAEHLAEVIAVCAGSGVLALAAVVALMRWADRRDARRVPPWAIRAAPAQTLTATVTPQAVQGTAPPAIVNNYYITVDPADREAARIIRQSLPGMAGEITEEQLCAEQQQTGAGAAPAPAPEAAAAPRPTARPGSRFTPASAATAS